MLQQGLYHTTARLNAVLSFLSDNWLVLMLSVLLAIILFYYWNLAHANAKQKSWLKKNQDLIVQYQALQLYLNDFGQHLCSCKNCNERDMQLWNFGQQLLVVRCSSCKMNYTFAKEQNQLILKVLIQIERVKVLFNTLISNKYDSLGRLLAHTLEIDVAALTSATTPLELVHFTAQSEYMITPKFCRNISVVQWEVVHSENIERLAS